jgi:DNA-binding transcriptional ArsR family regulator
MGTDEPGSGGQQVPRDLVFSVLSNSRRRLVLRYLRTVESTVGVRDLATQVAAWENGVPPAELTYKQRKRVYTSLHQTHLPKLDDAGFVTYDRDRGTVVYQDHATVLDPYLDAGSDPTTAGNPWGRYAVAVGVASLAAVALAAAGLPPFAWLPGLAWAALVALLVLALGGWHLAAVARESG